MGFVGFCIQWPYLVGIQLKRKRSRHWPLAILPLACWELHLLKIWWFGFVRSFPAAEQSPSLVWSLISWPWHKFLQLLSCPFPPTQKRLNKIKQPMTLISVKWSSTFLTIILLFVYLYTRIPLWPHVDKAVEESTQSCLKLPL